MITSDIGFWVDNYVGTYQIIESEGKKYIASKIYCSHTCGINVAKRRQRMRDKENPNRERLEPGFRNR